MKNSLASDIRSALCLLRELIIGLSLFLALANTTRADEPPTLEQAVTSKLDLWGERAIASATGPTYESFRDLLPPPRYVHADFRYYPIVLSAPRAKTKARLISNGSGVNLSGGSRSWREVGTPVTFRVGPEEYRFGELLDRVSLPTLADGYLPIVTIDYQHPFPVQAEGAVPLVQKPVERPAEIYRLEAFASVDPKLADYGIIWVRFSLAQGAKGLVSLDVDADSLAFTGQCITAETPGKEPLRIVHCDRGWKWSRQLAAASLTSDSASVIAIATKPLSADITLTVDEAQWSKERQLAVTTWNKLLDQGMQIEVPEKLVQDCWRNLIVQNFSILNENKIFYSASNQYEQLYEAEGGDAAMAFLAWGHESTGLDCLGPLLDFNRAGLQSNIAGLKLNTLIQAYWLTRNAQAIRELKPKWSPALERILTLREATTGLLPKERYCGDISTPVYSLSMQAKAWRALHDMSALFLELNDRSAAEQCSSQATEFHRAIVTALEKSLDRSTVPPFLPNALLDREEVHDPITEVRIGSYWNIIMPYVISSRIFPPGSEQESWLPRYLETHGGICMGLVRSGGTAHGFWTGSHRINPLYSLRYVLDSLRRDQIDRVLVSFYGMLAQGFTRNTFVVGEGCTLQPVDEGGRFFYCPPNSAGNAFFLLMLRNMLVSEVDANDDGKPDTLRLAAATPRAWLSDNQSIRVTRAPSAFGPISYRIDSHLASGTIDASIDLPSARRAEKVFLRLCLPKGKRIAKATAIEWSLLDSQDRSKMKDTIDIDALETLDLSRFTGRLKIRVDVD